MRQGDGTDLLGVSNPQSDSIGIIYVSVFDARQEILNAIMAQAELGRKQVAVVLPEQSRAFQQAVEFDGLKSIRKTIKAEVVFVAAAGSGPAEYARLRRFKVYPSLESYAGTFRPELLQPGAKKGWFGRQSKPAAGASQPVLLAASVPVQSPPVLPQQPVQQVTAAEVAGIAGVVGAAAVTTNMSDQDEEMLAAPSPPNARAKPTPPRPAGSDIIILPPPTAQRPRTTAHLQAAPAAAASASTSTIENAGTPPAQLAVPRRSKRRQKAAVATAAAALGAVGTVSAASFAQTGTPQAPGGQPPSGGGASTGGGGSSNQPKRGGRRLLAILLVLLTLLLLGGIAFASGAGQQLTRVITGSTQTAIVTITPASKDVSDNFIIEAVTGTPDPATRQVQASIISFTSQQSSASANATGSIPGAKASGTLLFLNLSRSPITISGGTLTGADGVQVSFSGPLTVPTQGTSQPAGAVNVGRGGNIAALDINGNCCGNSSIFVRNLTAFSGGVDPQPNMVIQQSDITSATNSLISAIQPAAQNSLKTLVKANQNIVPNTVNCSANVTPNHHSGDVATKVSVSGTVTCTEEVYDRDAALTMAMNALQAETKLGAAYGLVGNKIVASVTSLAGIDAKQTVSVVVSAAGVWAYLFPPSLVNQIANTIANKSKSDAQAYLTAQQGINEAVILISNGGSTLPDAAHITIHVNSVAGPSAPSGSPTTVPVNPSPTPNSGNTPTSTITPQNGQGGS